VATIDDALLAWGVPFVLATGYDKSSVLAQHARITRCEKPVDPGKGRTYALRSEGNPQEDLSFCNSAD
jgi:hypothetical protein